MLHARCTDTPIDRQSLMNESQSEYRSLEWKLGFVASTLPDLSGNPQLRLVDSIVSPCRNVHKYPRRFESQALQSRICERSPRRELAVVQYSLIALILVSMLILVIKIPQSCVSNFGGTGHPPLMEAGDESPKLDKNAPLILRSVRSTGLRGYCPAISSCHFLTGTDDQSSNRIEPTDSRARAAVVF